MIQKDRNMFPLLLLLVHSVSYVSTLDVNDPSTLRIIQKDLSHAVKTGEGSAALNRIANELELSDFVRGTSHWEYGNLTSSLASDKLNLFCSTCNVGFQELLTEISNGVPIENIINSLFLLCVDLGIGNEVLCNGFLEEAYPQIIFIIEQRPLLTGEELTGKDMCGMLFSAEGCSFDEAGPGRLWSVEISEGKPPLVEPEIPQDAPVMKILHLADTHFDPYYQPGSNAECGEKYFCCRNESGPVIAPEDAAGKWGDYRNCDAPRWTLEALYTHITDTHKDIDFIIWTGDLVPHVVWNTSEAGNLMIIREAVQMVKDFFPDIPVFPAIGNHEGHPVNTFPPPWLDEPAEWDVSWLYDEIMTLWSTWLPEDVAGSVAYSAYYSTLIMPGLRVLSINSNYCYGFNWWLLLDSQDVGEELNWMAIELQKAEEAGELVYIIQHIPPGHGDCYTTWSREYNRLVYRYESTIAGIFYGHTHKDHFQLFWSPDEPSRPYHVGYVAQSQTPYHSLNPGYKIYTIDGGREGATYRVLDHENWIMDLDETNANDEPSFLKLYDAKTAYNLDDLSPNSWAALVDEMVKPNSTAFDEFYKNYYKNARPYMEKGCNEKCKNSILCFLVISDNSDHTHCDDISEVLKLQ